MSMSGSGQTISSRGRAVLGHKPFGCWHRILKFNMVTIQAVLAITRLQMYQRKLQKRCQAAIKFLRKTSPMV